MFRTEMFMTGTLRGRADLCFSDPARPGDEFGQAAGDGGGGRVVARRVGAGAPPHQFGEAGAERAEGGGADGHAHVGDTQVTPAQEGLRALDPPGHQVVVRRLAVGGAELPGKVRRGHVRGPAQRGYVQRPGVFPVDQITGTSQVPEFVGPHHTRIDPSPEPGPNVRAARATLARMWPADRHDLIRVQGARENNLKDVSVEIPKRRLTVFTGVSGSGKSSLVFATIAAESQRLINETYSAFVQGFMPSLARPDVDLLEGLTTAIIVDQERMGTNSRSTVGTATDANAMLRIVFSRLGEPSAGPSFHYSFNQPAGACPRCEGTGTVTDIDLTQLFDDSKSLAEGAITIPGYTADGWAVRILSASGFFDPDKPIRDFTEQELYDFLYKEPVRVKVQGINLTYEGLVPKVQ